MRNTSSTLLYNWFDQVWNNENTNAIDELMAEDAIAHGIARENGEKGPAGFKIFFNNFKSNFSNVHVAVEEVVTEDNLEVARCKVTLTETATGKNAEFAGLCMARIEDGKIAEAWNHFDFLSLYQQLGQKM